MNIYTDFLKSDQLYILPAILMNTVMFLLLILGRLLQDPGEKFLLREFSSENNIQLNTSCMSTGHLLDQTPVRMLFDTRATKGYMSKSFYMANRHLFKVHKSSTSSKCIMVENGQHMLALFVIPVVIGVSGHLFEIYTIVADLNVGINLVFGMKIW